MASLTSLDHKDTVST